MLKLINLLSQTLRLKEFCRRQILRLSIEFAFAVSFYCVGAVSDYYMLLGGVDTCLNDCSPIFICNVHTIFLDRRDDSILKRRICLRQKDRTADFADLADRRGFIFLPSAKGEIWTADFVEFSG